MTFKVTHCDPMNLRSLSKYKEISVRSQHGLLRSKAHEYALTLMFVGI